MWAHPCSHLGRELDVRIVLRQPVRDRLVITDQPERLAVLDDGGVHARVLDRLENGICKNGVCVCINIWQASGRYLQKISNATPT